MKVDINLCTFRRPEVAETLLSINGLDVQEQVKLRVIVIDNDDEPSARAIVKEMAARMRFLVTYVHAPARNISLARNAGLDHSDADWVAFLDDDEIVQQDWLTALIERQDETAADAIFGHSRARYTPAAPEWIVKLDYHSNIVEARGGVVETGYSCNAFLRWGNASWTKERFDPARGRSGGEDTEFFFRLRRLGARYAITDKANVYEAVPPERLSFQWLRRRRFRMGQSYSASAVTLEQKLKLLCLLVARFSFAST